MTYDEEITLEWLKSDSPSARGLTSEELRLELIAQLEQIREITKTDDQRQIVDDRIRELMDEQQPLHLQVVHDNEPDLRDVDETAR